MTFNWLAQIASVTWLNIRTLPRRPASSIVSVIGIAGVVAVFFAPPEYWWIAPR
mgnify:CR=1 FL=1